MQGRDMDARELAQATQFVRALLVIGLLIAVVPGLMEPVEEKYQTGRLISWFTLFGVLGAVAVSCMNDLRRAQAPFFARLDQIAQTRDEAALERFINGEPGPNQPGT